MKPPLHGVRQVRDSDSRPDAELVRAVADFRDEDAFETLVARHAPAVWAICRRAFSSEADAEDAFQTTFLLLHERSRRIRRPSNIRHWLCGVALRVTRNARALSAKRRRRETEAAKRYPRICNPGTEGELWEAIARELESMPEGERIAIVLCGIEGELRPAVAGLLGWSLGTLSARLSRGRRRLALFLLDKGLMGDMVLSGLRILPKHTKAPKSRKNRSKKKR